MSVITTAPRYKDKRLTTDVEGQYRICDMFPSRYGTWINAHGYVLQHVKPVRKFLFFTEDIWEFTLDLVFPLTWFDGMFYHQSDWHTCETNLGSVPFPFDRLVTKTGHPRSFAFHDDFCNRLGSYRAVKFAGPYAFTPFHEDKRKARLIGDKMLRQMYPAESVLQGHPIEGKFWRHPVFLGVRVGSIWQKDPIR